MSEPKSMTNQIAAEVQRYWIVDSVTGVTWAMGGAFRDRETAHREMLRLAWKYANSDLRVVQAQLKEAEKG